MAAIAARRCSVAVAVFARTRALAVSGSSVPRAALAWRQRAARRGGGVARAVRARGVLTRAVSARGRTRITDASFYRPFARSSRGGVIGFEGDEPRQKKKKKKAKKRVGSMRTRRRRRQRKEVVEWFRQRRPMLALTAKWLRKVSAEGFLLVARLE